MRVIIAGSRSIRDPEVIAQAVSNSGFDITEVVDGRSRGPDELGGMWADDNGIPTKDFPANWYHDGIFDPAAGFKRNQQMVDYAEALIAIWDGRSKDTRDVITRAKLVGLLLYVHRI